MSFADTYREERLISRRSRARKARIAGRVIGFALTAMLVVALRTEPQLRAMVEDLALAVIGGAEESRQDAAGAAQTGAIDALGFSQGSEEAQLLEQLGIGETQVAPLTSRLPPSTVPVRRPNSG